MTIPLELQLTREIIRIRVVEEFLKDIYPEKMIRCPIHLSIGVEGSAVGLLFGSEKSDLVFSNHRSHAHYLAKGGDLYRFFAELLGRRDGCARGRGGSMHLIDSSVGFEGSTAIVGGTVPVGVGAAWAKKIKAEPGVVFIFFGDGAMEEGVVSEALNFASLHELPVIFICENNRLSCYTDIDVRQPMRPIVDLARGHGIKTISLVGSDVLEIRLIAEKSIRQVKAGSGPLFFEIEVARWGEHCGPENDLHLGYRTETEIEKIDQLCPLLNSRAYFNSDSEFSRFYESVAESTLKFVKKTWARALRSPFPAPFPRAIENVRIGD